MNQPDNSNNGYWDVIGPLLTPAFLLSCPISIPAYLMWVDHRATTGLWSPLHARLVESCLIYVLLRVILDGITVFADRIRARGWGAGVVVPDERNQEGKVKFSWTQYFVVAWFNIGEVAIGLVAFVSTIHGGFSVGHGLDPIDIANQLYPSVNSVVLVACIIAASLGPVAIFDSIAVGRLPLPYRWVGAKVLPKDRIIFPWDT